MVLSDGTPAYTPDTKQQLAAPTATTGLSGMVRGAMDNVAPRFGSTAQNVVEGMPRMAVDVGALMTPAAPAGLADMGLSSYTGARHAGVGEAGSLGAGALGVLGAGLYGPAEGVASDVGGALASKVSTHPLAAQLGRFLGGQAGIAGVGAGQQVAQRSIETGSPTQALKEQITPENIFGSIAGQLPFAAMGAHNFTEQPNAINAEGKLVAANSGGESSDPQTNILNQFLGGAQNSAEKPVPDMATPPTTEPTPQIDPTADNPEAKLAHDTFAQQSGLDKQDEVTPQAPIAPSSSSTAEPDFSLINPLGADFSSKKAMTPPIILNSLLNGEIRPTDAPDNMNNAAMVQQLQSAFVDDAAMQNGYVDMNKVGHAAELANLQQRGIPLTQPQQAAWSRLTPVEQQGAHIASKILNDPYTTMGMAPDTQDALGNTVAKGGLDPRRWEVDPNFGPESFMRSVYQGAANMTEKWARPITSVQDAASLVRDTNSFVKNISDFMDQNGFAKPAQDQLTKLGLFEPITQERLQERYNTFMQDYLNNPSAEAAARSLQWVKNQTWLAARAARETMMKDPRFADPELGAVSDKGQQADMQAEQGFQDAMQKVPAPLQDILQKQYIRARQEREGRPGTNLPTWSLNDYRKSVADAINGLQPEDLAKLNDVDPASPRDVLNKIAVLKQTDEGKTIRTNLGKTIFEPKGSLAYSGSARREESSGIIPKQAERLTDEDQQADSEQAQKSKEDSVMSKFFNGEPGNAASTLENMSPQQFKRAFITNMDTAAKTTDTSRVWKERMAKYAALTGQPVDEVTKDGSGDNWMRQFVQVDAAGDTQQRRAWADANGFEGKKWIDVQQSMLSRDYGKQLMWKARMLGLEPKIGTTPEAVKAAIGEQSAKSTKAPTTAPVKTDFVGFIRKDLLNRGYQPELAEQIAKSAKGMADHFWWIDNADFATLTDREGAAQRFYKQMQVLGMHLPDQTIVNGQPIKNPIIALMQKDLVQREGYAPLNTFLKITGLGHEAYHNLQTGVVDNPNFKPTNEDTQTVIDSVHSMQANAASMTAEDRAMSANALVDLMIPPKFSRDKNGKFLPEVQGLINAVSQNPKEYSAFMFQMATAGIASHGDDTLSGVPRADKIAKEYQDSLSWFSPDTIAFMRGQFRYLGDHLDSLQRVLDDPDFRAEKGLTYQRNETYTKNPKAGDVISSTIHEGGRTSEIVSPEDTTQRKTTFTVPPTQGVGTRTRAVAEAAIRIAKSEPQAAPGPLKGAPVDTPSHYAVLRAMAKIDKRVEQATTTIKQLITNLGGGTLSGGKTVDLTDVQGAKDFMSTVGATPPGSNGPIFKNPVDIAGECTPDQIKYDQNLATRFLSPLQYRTADLSRRGLDVAESARQNIDRIYSIAHTMANNMRGAIVDRVGRLGAYGLDPKTGYFKFFHDNMNEFDSAANVAMGKISNAQQEMGGVDVSDPKLQKVIAEATKGLPDAQRLQAVSAVKDMNQVYRTSMASQIKAQGDHENAFVARVIMKQNPSKYDSKSVQPIAQLVQKAAQGDLSARQGLMQEVASGKMTPQSLATAEQVGLIGWDKVNKLTSIAQANQNFMSEGRFGRYMLFYKTDQGKTGSMGFNDPADARTYAENRQLEGATDMRFVDKRDLTHEQFLASNVAGMDNIKQLVAGTFQKQLEAIVKADPVNGPALAKSLQETADPVKAIDNYTLTNSLQKLTAFKRRMTAGREFLNPVATMEEYVASSSNGIAKRAAKDQHALYMEELNQQGLSKIAKDLDVQMNERLAPTNETATKLTTIGTAAYIGGDVARSVIDSTLGFTLGIPTMIQGGVSVPKAHEYYFKGAANVIKNLLNTSEFNASADRGTAAARGQGVLTKDSRQDTINSMFRRMNDEGRLQRAPIIDTLIKDSQKANLEKAARMGNYEPQSATDMALSPFYNVAKALLRAHSWLPSFNQKISADAALNAGYDKGLRGEELYQHANSLLDTMTAAAGRANKPVGFSYVTGQGSPGSEFRRSAVGFATMMQQYGLSQTFGMAHMLKDAVGATPGLNTEQRKSAAKAASYGLAMNTALGGALGLTGAQYVFAAINKLFHHDLEGDARVGLQKFYNKFISEDEQQGGLFSDTVMNGLANHLTGLDFAGRSGVSSLFGISPYGETNMFDLLGPSAGLIDNLVEGLSDVTAGKPWLGAREIAPRALKPFVEMYGNYKQFGDNRIMDQNNNLLMQPNAAQSIGYALGWQPARVRQMRQEGRLMNTAQDNYQVGREADINSYARGVLNGQPQAALQEAYGRQFQPGFNPKDFIDQVTERALDMQTQKDPMTKGSVLNAQSQDAIGSTFDNPKQSEVARVRMKDQLLMQMGLPFGSQMSSSQDLLRAMMVDQLRQQRGMGREEALATLKRAGF